MRRFFNTTATIEELELHGFWDRRRETLVITGITVGGFSGATTQAFWLSICRQLDLPTSLAREQGPAELLRYLLHHSPATRFGFCVETHEDGNILFRAPRISPDAQEGTRQGYGHATRPDESCRQTSSSDTVPPCQRTRLAGAAAAPRSCDRPRSNAACVRRLHSQQWQRVLGAGSDSSAWIASPLKGLRPSRN